MTDNKKNEKVYVFLNGEPKSGISKKTGQPYELNKIEFADPLTYENHKLDFKKGLNLSFLNKGDHITLVTDFASGYNGSDSRSIVIDALLVK